ncbi:hypothetical protein ACVZFM_27955, partial [Pseudomonas aeruginosa]
AGSRKQEAGSRKQEAGSRKQEAGSRKQDMLLYGYIRPKDVYSHRVTMSRKARCLELQLNSKISIDKINP